MDINLLTMDIVYLEFSSKDNIRVLRGFKGEFPESYKNKYIDLLFELSYEVYELSSFTKKGISKDNEEDMKILLDHFARFVASYSRLIQYFDFADVDTPTKIHEDFIEWKNRRLDLLEYLKGYSQNKTLK